MSIWTIYEAAVFLLDRRIFRTVALGQIVEFWQAKGGLYEILLFNQKITYNVLTTDHHIAPDAETPELVDMTEEAVIFSISKISSESLPSRGFPLQSFVLEHIERSSNESLSLNSQGEASILCNYDAGSSGLRDIDSIDESLSLNSHGQASILCNYDAGSSGLRDINSLEDGSMNSITNDCNGNDSEDIFENENSQSLSPPKKKARVVHWTDWSEVANEILTPEFDSRGIDTQNLHSQKHMKWWDCDESLDGTIDLEPNTT